MTPKFSSPIQQDLLSFFFYGTKIYTYAMAFSQILTHFKMKNSIFFLFLFFTRFRYFAIRPYFFLRRAELPFFIYFF